jgi:hypothetical protein
MAMSADELTGLVGLPEKPPLPIRNELGGRLD